jgi:hypothetical protein
MFGVDALAWVLQDQGMVIDAFDQIQKTPPPAPPPAPLGTPDAAAQQQVSAEKGKSAGENTRGRISSTSGNPGASREGAICNNNPPPREDGGATRNMRAQKENGSTNGTGDLSKLVESVLRIDDGDGSPSNSSLRNRVLQQIDEMMQKIQDGGGGGKNNSSSGVRDGLASNVDTKAPVHPLSLADEAFAEERQEKNRSSPTDRVPEQSFSCSSGALVPSTVTSDGVELSSASADSRSNSCSWRMTANSGHDSSDKRILAGNTTGSVARAKYYQHQHPQSLPEPAGLFFGPCRHCAALSMIEFDCISVAQTETFLKGCATFRNPTEVVLTSQVRELEVIDE